MAVLHGAITGRLFASNDQKTDLNYPLASLRSPKSDRLLGELNPLFIGTRR